MSNLPTPSAWRYEYRHADGSFKYYDYAHIQPSDKKESMKMYTEGQMREYGTLCAETERERAEELAADKGTYFRLYEQACITLQSDKKLLQRLLEIMNDVYGKYTVDVPTMIALEDRLRVRKAILEQL